MLLLLLARALSLGFQYFALLLHGGNKKKIEYRVHETEKRTWKTYRNSLDTSTYTYILNSLYILLDFVDSLSSCRL